MVRNPHIGGSKTIKSCVRGGLASTKDSLNPSVSVRLPIAVIKHHDLKQLREKRRYIILTLPVHPPRNSRREMEEETDEEAMEKWCFLACSSWLVQPASL